MTRCAVKLSEVLHIAVARSKALGVEVFSGDREAEGCRLLEWMSTIAWNAGLAVTGGCWSLHCVSKFTIATAVTGAIAVAAVVFMVQPWMTSLVAEPVALLVQQGQAGVGWLSQAGALPLLGVVLCDTCAYCECSCCCCYCCVHAAALDDKQPVAVLMHASAELLAQLPALGPQHMKQQKMAYLNAAAAALGECGGIGLAGQVLGLATHIAGRS